MPRSKNDFPSQPLTLSVIEPTYRYLKRLVATGLYGNTESDVVRNIVLERIRHLINEGKLVELPPMEKEKEKP